MDYETKDPTTDPEIKSAFDEFLCAFEEFKQANDERLKQIETRSADVVTGEKVERINRALDEQKRALDELTLAAARPSLGGEFKAAPDRATRERKAAFDRYVRKGDAGRLRCARSEGALGRLRSRWRLCRAAGDRTDHRSHPRQGLAHPRPGHRAPDRLQHLSQAHHHGRSRVGLGRRNRHAARKPPRPRSAPSIFRPWSFTPCRRRPRPCSTTRRSTSSNGWPRRCRSSSPNRKAPPSSPATAPTSPRAS